MSTRGLSSRDFFSMPRTSRMYTSGPISSAPAAAGQGAQLKGGVGTDALEKRQWSKTAPEWRTTGQGLCIEGLCPTPACKAYGHHVIFNAGFTSLDLMSSARPRCPLCFHKITPTTAAFNNCEWRFSGIKLNSTDPDKVNSTDPDQPSTEKVEMEEWEVAGNQYERFREDGDDDTVWKSLVLTTRPMKVTPSTDPSPDLPMPSTLKKRARQDTDSTAVGNCSDPNLVECAICCADRVARFDPKAINTPCGHCFHRECLKPWVLSGKSCPTCRRDISCLAIELQKIVG